MLKPVPVNVNVSGVESAVPGTTGAFGVSVDAVIVGAITDACPTPNAATLVITAPLPVGVDGLSIVNWHVPAPALVATVSVADVGLKIVSVPKVTVAVPQAPDVIVAPGSKPDPEIVIGVAAVLAGSAEGDTSVIPEAVTVNEPTEVAAPWSGFVIVTVYVPAGAAACGELAFSP